MHPLYLVLHLTEVGLVGILPKYETTILLIIRKLYKAVNNSPLYLKCTMARSGYDEETPHCPHMVVRSTFFR